MKNLGLSRRSFFAASAALSGGALLGTNAVKANTGGYTSNPLYGPPVGAAKLNANENPFGPSPAALKAMVEATQSGAYYDVWLDGEPRRVHGLCVGHQTLPCGLVPSRGGVG